MILVVSTLEPRKNGRFLLDWFLSTDVLLPRTEIWWVGPAGWLLNLAYRRRWTSARKRHIRFLGVLPDRELCKLYRQAAFAIYPSLYEGFGFPVLDALWHGTPVLSSLNSSLQEFAGPGVHFFDPCDPASLDSACEEVLNSWPERVHRDDLEARFSWENLARQVMALCS